MSSSVHVHFVVQIDQWIWFPVALQWFDTVGWITGTTSCTRFFGREVLGRLVLT